MIQTSCPHCGNPLTFQPQHAGREGQCDRCNGLLIVPAPTQYAQQPYPPGQQYGQQQYAPQPQPYGNRGGPPAPPRPSAPAAAPTALDSLADLSNPQQQQQGGYQQQGYDQGYQQGYDNYGYQQGGYQQGGYQQVGYRSAHRAPEGNTLGIVGFILSFLAPLIGFIICIIAMKKEPKGFAIAGLIISGLYLLVTLVVVIIMVAAAS